MPFTTFENDPGPLCFLRLWTIPYFAEAFPVATNRVPEVLVPLAILPPAWVLIPPEIAGGKTASGASNA